MWNLIDSNKIVSTQSKVNYFKNHLSSIKSMKPRIRMQTPWKPSFSLSKRHNKYYRMNTTQVNKQNQTLIEHIMTIAEQPRENTVNQIPRTIPSNKKTFKQFKSRERKRQRQQIDRQNMKILSKIETTSSFYQKNKFQKEWSKNKVYKQNIAKKDAIPDFYELAKESMVMENSRNKSMDGSRYNLAIRPKTAFPR